MMKMKEVCKETGLSERAVRLYVKEQLIEPKIVESLHRNEYFFSERDVEILKNIAVLRKAGFGIADIKHMQIHQEDIPAFVEEKKKLLEDQIFEQTTVRDALERLSLGEKVNTEKLADALSPAMNYKEKEKTESRRRIQTGYRLGIFVIMSILLILVAMKSGGFIMSVVLGFASLILAGISFFMSMRYATVAERAKRLPEKGVGTVLDVTEEHGLDIAFARAGTGIIAAGQWGGNSGIWQLAWMLWNEIRPDCWFPIISYENEKGEKQLATFLYGGMKNSWEIGETVEIAWSHESPERVLPLGGSWCKKKCRTYVALGVILLFVSSFCIMCLVY